MKTKWSYSTYQRRSRNHSANRDVLLDGIPYDEERENVLFRVILELSYVVAPKTFSQAIRTACRDQVLTRFERAAKRQAREFKRLVQGVAA
jgi:hypothetical protein